MPRILVVDDERTILDRLEALLRGAGFDVETQQSGREALVGFERSRPDVVVTDIRVPAVNGLDILSEVRRRDPRVPVILMTAQASLQSAMKAVNGGAFYYLRKPFGNDDLVALCRRAADATRLAGGNTRLAGKIRCRTARGGEKPIGENPAFVEVLRLAETVSPTESTVLITGESGTGKEIVARYIHRLSDRNGRAFVSINCGALPDSLLESELFGHVEGSFTGAVKDKRGLLIAAQGGTFFLDEVGEMSPALQVKLLRALQEREVVPVGATEPVKIDVRIIAATNREIEQEMRQGTFRSDLYYRLNVITLHLPPLRERVEDVALLADHFLARLPARRRGTENGRAPRLSAEALAVLQRYDWPGNVRELENALERAAILSAGDRIGPDTLPGHIREPRPASLISKRPPSTPTLDVIERAYIRWVLEAERGNKARAAEVLGIDPSTLYRKLNRYGMSK